MAVIEDMTLEILLRLPAKSLLRFKCVSKQWKSIISSPNFRRLYSIRRSAAIAGLFLIPSAATEPSLQPRYFVDLQGENHHVIIPSDKFVVSLNSCNGLLCIGFSDAEDTLYGPSGNEEFFVFNPTTNQHRLIPELYETRYDVIAMNIAFDPSKSDHYKLVCVYSKQKKRRIEATSQSRFSVFSSEIGVWEDSGVPLTDVSFYNRSGAFLNGAIHWYCGWNKFLCFNIDHGRLETMPCIQSLPSPDHFDHLRIGSCFGESGGHLHFICGPLSISSMLMTVFEMKNDYSEWFIKFRVDLSPMIEIYPKLGNPDIQYDELDVYIAVGMQLFIVNEGNTGLVKSFPPCSIMLYNWHDMSITDLPVDEWPDDIVELVELEPHRWFFTCKHIESLASV